MAKQKNPNSNPKSGGIAFAITAVGSFLLFGGLKGIIIGVALGLGVGKVFSIMGSGLDTTTHNKQDEERRRELEAAHQRAEEARLKAEEARRKAEEERRKQEAASQIPLTGDPLADEIITKGVQSVKEIREANAAIPDHILTDQMNRICVLCERIFRSVSDAPSKAPQVRKFMNYYLPTSLKILNNYRVMDQRGVSWQEMQSVRDTTARGLNMILTACQKQIDNLHRDEMLDISTDIDVLEQMLKRDGYTESELGPIRDVAPAEPATAMEAQMRGRTVPVLKFPESSGRPSNTDTARRINQVK